MKPIVPFILLAWSLISWSSGLSAEADLHGRQFRAGAATSNITPSLGVVLDGAIMQIGPAKHVHDELEARCLVLDDGSTRIGFAVCDVTMIETGAVEQAKRFIEADTGLAADHVLISATHTHSAPRVMDLGQGEANRAYADFLARRIADGIHRAMNQLAPAKIGWGSGQKPEYVFNRRWFVKPELEPPNPFGTKPDEVATNPPPASIIKPAGPVDPELFVLSVQHADGRPLALLANYGLHYVGGLPSGHISADYFGVFADRIQQLLGADRQEPPFVGIMSNGTSGDVNNVDLRNALRRRPSEALMREVADGVAQEALKVVRDIQHHEWVPLSVRTVTLNLGVRRPDEARLQWARGISADTKPDQRMARPAIYAREALELAKYPPTVPITLQAFRIGDLGIGAAPCEVFAETGLAIKKQSPFGATFTVELANGYGGYLPTPEQHGLGGYETWPARSAFLELTAEPKIRAGILDVLQSLREPVR